MLKRKMIGLLALFLSAGLTVAACGDDNTDGNNGNNGDNNGSDAGDTGTEDATDPGDTDPEPEGCTSDEECMDGYTCDTSTTPGTCVEAPSGCELTGDDRPERCDQDFEGTEFGPGSLVTSFQVAGNADDGSPECCFDFNSDQESGDDEIDNALGGALDGLALGDINEGIQDSIDSGDLLLVFEHEGLSAYDAGETYGLNFFLGEYDENNNLLIDPASIDQGTYPQARVENAQIDGTTLTAGPGVVQLDINLLDTPLSLVISQAQIEAEIDTSADLSEGVVLTNGKLGGVIRVRDIMEALNGFAANSCECLGLGDDPLVHYDPDNVGCFDEDDDIDGTYQGEECGCNVPEAENTCEEDSTCASIASYCDTVYLILPGVSDVDTDADGEPDAISIGATFDTTGAVFTGIAAE